MINKHERVFQLYMEQLAGVITPEGDALLQEMLAGDPELASFYAGLQKDAASMPLADFLGGVDAGEGLGALRKEISLRGETGERSRRVMIRRTLSAAAVLMIVAAGLWIFLGRSRVLVNKEEISAAVEKKAPRVYLQTSSGQSIDLNANKSVVLGNTTLRTGKDELKYTSEDTTENTLSIPAGENYKVVLSDGTEVTLNAASRLRFPFRFGSATREVYLDGEAYFKVAQESRRPFIVHTPLTRINVLGTSFNVNCYDKDRVKTSLVEGKVSTQGNDGGSTAGQPSGDKTVVLNPGYASAYVASKGFSTGKFDEDELSWIGGVYYFHDMPVADVARIASRCYGIHIVVDEQKFAGKSLSGLMDRRKLSDFLSDVESTIHVKFRYSDSNLYLE